jgi:hypothetical protein
MKRIYLIVSFLLVGLNLFAQNDFKYQVRAFGGLQVGGNYVTKSSKVKIDSISSTAGDIKFYNGATILLPYNNGKVNVSDTANMLSHYALSSELGEAGLSETEVADQIHDTMDIRMPLKSNIVSPTFTGIVITPALKVGGSAKVQIDSISSVASDVKIYHGSDTLAPYIPYAYREQIGEMYVYDTTYLYYKIDSLIAEVQIIKDDLATLIENINNLGLDIAPPRFLSAEIGDYADDTLVVVFDTTDVHQDSIPSVEGFDFTANGTHVVLDTALISNDSLFLVLADPGTTSTTTYLLDYTSTNATQNGKKRLQDSTLNKVNSWVNKPVTNNLPILVTGISVWGTGGATTITVSEGTLQMLKKTLPTNAADTSNTWSVDDEDIGTISAGGLLTAVSNGVVEVTSTADDGSAVHGHRNITISNQAVTPPSFLSSDTYTKGWYMYGDGSATYMSRSLGYIYKLEDQSSSGWDLISPATYRPVKDSVNLEIDFDGVNDYLENDAVSYTFPMTIYMVVAIHADGAGKALYRLGFSTLNIRTGSLHGLTLMGGGEAFSTSDSYWTDDTYYIIRNVHNNDVSNGSKIQINANTAVTGTLGTESGYSILRIGSHNDDAASMSIKEVIFRVGIVDTDPNQTSVINYLNAKYSIY